MKSIAIVIQKLYGGGAEHAACNLSLFLQGRYQVTLAAFDGSKSSYPHTDRVADIGIPAAHTMLQRVFLLPRRVSRLRRIKKENHVQVSIGLLSGPSMANAFSRRKGEKVVMSVRNYLSLQEVGRVSALKTRLTAAASDRVVAVSRAAALDLVKNYNIPEDKIRVIYNAVDPDLLSGECDMHVPFLEKDSLLVVTMGRLHEQKGHWHLIRAFARVVKRVPNAKLVIFGDGKCRDRLMELAKRLHIEKNVFLPGYVVSPYGYVRRSALFVLSSLYEGMPNAMLEAMACSVPVVSTDCLSGPREILAPDTSVEEIATTTVYAQYGILTPPLDQEHFNAEEPLTNGELCLADAIERMLTDEELRKSYKEKAFCRALDFSPEKISAEWAALVEEVSAQEVKAP